MKTSWFTKVAPFALVLAAGGLALYAQSQDFETYRTRVEPIFLKKRPTHARCIVCHEGERRAFALQPLSEGATNWTEEQSRQNYKMIRNLIVPGDPSASILLKHPLAGDAGGDDFHSGGRQFASTSDSDYQAIADWIRNTKK